MIKEYHKSKLNSKCQIAYDQMVNAFCVYQTMVECKGLNGKEIGDTYQAVFFDHPEFFYISHAPKAANRVSLFGSTSSLITSLIFPKNEIFQYRSTMDKILKGIALTTKSITDELAIEKIICDYILKNVVYEIDNDYNQNAGTVLVKNKGQCSGIAKAVKYICDYLGLECILINGTATDNSSGTVGPHSWNIIKINGIYYHLDVTFMIGANMQKRQPFNYLYLNYSDAQIEKNHQWDKNYYPKCNVATPTSQPKATYASNNSYNNAPSNSYNSAQNQNAQKPSKIISSYQQFRLEIGKVFDNRAKNLSFTSKIAENDGQVLINNLIKEASSVRLQKGIGCSIRVSVSNDVVSIDIDNYQPRNTSNTRNVNQTPNAYNTTPYNSTAAKPSKIISSYLQFRNEASIACSNKLKNITFTSKIVAKDVQDLLNNLTNEFYNVATAKNISCSYNITICDDVVTVAIKYV